MSDTPRRKQGVPTLTTIGYTGTLPGSTNRPPSPAKGIEPSLSTRQGFAPVRPTSVDGSAIPDPGRTVAHAGTMPMPMLDRGQQPRPEVAAALERFRNHLPPAPGYQNPPPAYQQPAPAYQPSPPNYQNPHAVAMPMPSPMPATVATPPDRARGQAAPGVSEEALTSVWQVAAAGVIDSSTDEVPHRRFQRWWFLLPVAPLSFVFAYLIFGAPEPVSPAASPALASLPSSPALASGALEQSVVIERGSIAVSTAAKGAVNGPLRSGIMSDTAGVVAAVLVKNGQQVKTGDPLVTFAVSSGRRELRLADQAVTDRKAEHHVLRLRRDAIRKDLNSGLLWPAEMEAIETELGRAEGRLKAAVAARRRAEERTAGSALQAPMDGVVRDLQVQPGQRVDPGKRGRPRPLLVIEQPGQMAVWADLPAEAAGRVEVGSKARVSIEGLRGQTFDAEVTALTPAAQGATAAGGEVVRAELRLNAGEEVGEIAPGTGALAHFRVGRKEGVLLVPAAAIKTDNAGSTVEVWSSEQKQYERRVVQTGESDETHTEVISNISEGERVRVPGKG